MAQKWSEPYITAMGSPVKSRGSAHYEQEAALGLYN